MGIAFPSGHLLWGGAFRQRDKQGPRSWAENDPAVSKEQPGGHGGWRRGSTVTWGQKRDGSWEGKTIQSLFSTRKTLALTLNEMGSSWRVLSGGTGYSVLGFNGIIHETVLKIDHGGQLVRILYSEPCERLHWLGSDQELVWAMQSLKCPLDMQ